MLCLILAVCSVIFPAGVAEASTTDTGFSAVNLGLGVLLVIVAFRSRHRSSRFAVPNNTEPGNASPPVEPQLLNRMHGISQRGAFLAGMGIATMPPAVVAGTAFARSDTTPGSKLLAGFGFVVLSTASLWLPLIGLRAAPKRAGSQLEHLHQWLARNYDDIVFWVLAGLGVLLMAHELAVILG